MKTVLIAHSDPETARTIESALMVKGAAVVLSSDGEDALEQMSRQLLAGAVIEMDLPKVNGWRILEQSSRNAEGGPPVVLTSQDKSARAAMDAVRAGAFDYLATPVDPAEMSACLARMLDYSGGESAITQKDGAPFRFDNIIGQSPAIKNVFRLVEKVAATDSTVMIYGESGTGKELIARAIHQNSRRRDKSLIPVNCGAIPEELLESELFGHEKGAFTSAIRTRIGRFEMADSGTIFLDEIADMSPKLQVKILRVLQEHQFERIGGGKTIDVNIRVITATNKNLRQAVERERFREDLFYRLNVIPITVPPLRERKQDIPLLVDHFLARFRETRGDEVEGINDEAMKKIVSYSWPGNIRELENIIERMVILAEENVLTVQDLPPRIAETEVVVDTSAPTVPDDGLDFNQVVSDFENQLLVQALEKSGWVKNKAAKMLQLNRTTLVEKLKKKGITPPK